MAAPRTYSNKKQLLVRASVLVTNTWLQNSSTYGGGHWSHVTGQEGSDLLLSYLTDKIVDVVLLFLVCYTHSLIVERLGGLVGLVQKMLGVERRSLGESCLADRHCEALLVCYIGNESPDSAGKIIMLLFAFYVNVCYFAAADGVCEPSMLVIGLSVVVALFLLLFCCCCACFCFKRRVTIRRSLLDDFWTEQLWPVVTQGGNQELSSRHFVIQAGNQELPSRQLVLTSI